LTAEFNYAKTNAAIMELAIKESANALKAGKGKTAV
jgi:hypothetical protein